MKIGSLVECIKDFTPFNEWNIIIPKIKRIYTIRDIRNENGHLYICLEEIVNHKPKGFRLEPAFHIDFFREVDEIELNLEEILEMIEV